MSDDDTQAEPTSIEAIRREIRALNERMQGLTQAYLTVSKLLTTFFDANPHFLGGEAAAPRPGGPDS